MRSSRPKVGVLRVVRISGGAWARVSCIFSSEDRDTRVYGCRWTVALLRRGTYIGLALVKFYKSQGGFDVETLWAKCRPVNGSKICVKHPPPR
jgi:hypothetical protein